MATSEMLAKSPKDRSADLLFAAVLHDPALEIVRTKCQSPFDRSKRLEWVRGPRPYPCRSAALAGLAFLRGRVMGRSTRRPRRP